MTCMLDAYKCMGANVFFVCFARETLGTKNAKCKCGCSFSFASETLGTKQIEVYMWLFCVLRFANARETLGTRTAKCKLQSQQHGAT